MSRPDEIVVLGMFDLTHLGSAMAVRIHNLYQALQDIAPTTLLSGSRMARRRAVLRYLLQGRLSHARALYVEASNGPANELDLLFIMLAKATGIPVFIFIPDAYQYFSDLFPRRGPKMKLLDLSWRLSIATYLKYADILLFPSWGLADLFDTHRRKDVFPPAGSLGRANPSINWSPPTIAYVGGATVRYGIDLLLDAMERVVSTYPDIRCHVVAHPPEAAAKYSKNSPSWLTVEHRSFHELPEIMSSVTMVISPLRVNPYNDLAVPVKLFDYMSFGRPIVATACRDTAFLLSQLESGLVVDDTVEGLTQGIIHLLENRNLATRLGQNGYHAIQTSHSWSHRARYLLRLIEEIECDGFRK